MSFLRNYLFYHLLPLYCRLKSAIFSIYTQGASIDIFIWRNDNCAYIEEKAEIYIYGIYKNLIRFEFANLIKLFIFYIKCVFKI